MARDAVFNQEPVPLHTGKKMSSTTRSRSADPPQELQLRFGRKKNNEHCASQMNLDRTWFNKNQEPSEPRHKVGVQSKQSNKSRCPWEPTLLSARGGREGGKRIVSAEPRRQVQRGLGRGPSQEPAKPVESKKKTDSGRLAWRIQSQENDWRPTRRVVRSASADFPPPERKQSARYVNPSFSRLQESTSLQGRENAREEHISGIRVVRTPSEDPIRTPWVEAAARNTSLEPARQPSPSRPAPYGTCVDTEAIKSNVGKRSEFRPHNRVFSRQQSHQDTHANIFGNRA